MGNDIKIKVASDGKFQVLKVTGKIDAEASPVLTTELNKQISAGKYFIVLDLSGVNFMSSAGIGVTVKALNDCRSKSGDLRIAEIQEDVRKVYELLGFAGAFRFFDSLSAATSA